MQLPGSVLRMRANEAGWYDLYCRARLLRDAALSTIPASTPEPQRDKDVRAVWHEFWLDLVPPSSDTSPLRRAALVR